MKYKSKCIKYNDVEPACPTLVCPPPLGLPLLWPSGRAGLPPPLSLPLSQQLAELQPPLPLPLLNLPHNEALLLLLGKAVNLPLLALQEDMCGPQVLAPVCQDMCGPQVLAPLCQDM